MGRTVIRTLICAALLLSLPAAALAQAQAANGNIEGVVRDASGGVLPGVTVTVTNTGTGTERSSVTNENGVYRLLLLPLGTYQVVAELSGFRRIEQSGFTLSAGQTLTVDLSMTVGGVQETVTVSGETPVIDSAKIDAGRNLSEREIKNLPLV